MVYFILEVEGFRHAYVVINFVADILIIFVDGLSDDFDGNRHESLDGLLASVLLFLIEVIHRVHTEFLT